MVGPLAIVGLGWAALHREPSVGLGCIYQHPGEREHLILAPAGRVTGSRGWPARAWHWAELVSPYSGSEPATQFSFIKTEPASNMGFLPVLETGSLLACRRNSVVVGPSENIESNSSYCTDGDKEAGREERISSHCPSLPHYWVGCSDQLVLF